MLNISTVLPVVINKKIRFHRALLSTFRSNLHRWYQYSLSLSACNLVAFDDSASAQAEFKSDGNHLNIIDFLRKPSRKIPSKTVPDDGSLSRQILLTCSSHSFHMSAWKSINKTLNLNKVEEAYSSVVCWQVGVTFSRLEMSPFSDTAHKLNRQNEQQK